MANPTYKKIEIVGTSNASFSKAVENGVKKAGETLHNLSWFEVKEFRGHIKDGAVDQYQVVLKIGFRLD